MKRTDVKRQAASGKLVYIRLLLATTSVINKSAEEKPDKAEEK